MPIQFKNFEAANKKRNIIDFNLFHAGWDTSWIADNVQGGVGGAPVKQDLTASLNGVLQDFTVSPTPSGSDTVLVVFNGLVKRRGDSSGYTLTGSALHTNFLGSSGDSLVLWIW